MPYPQRPPRRTARPRSKGFASLSRKLFLAYTVFVIYGTTIPFRFRFSAPALQRGLEDFLADPLQLNTASGLSIPDITSNFLFFVPFGFLLSLALPTAREHVRGRVLLKVFVAACLLSTLVEFLQLFERSRTTSLLDVAVNGSGAILGAALGLAVTSRFSQGALSRAEETLRYYPTRAVLLLYAMILVVWGLSPFDVTLDVSTLGQSLKGVDFSFSTSIPLLAELAAHAILLAAFAFLWLESRESTVGWGSLTLAISYTALLAISIELLQVFFVSHTTKLSDALAGLAGGIYGATVFTIVRSRNQMAPAARSVKLLNLAALHWLFYVLLVALAPFDFSFGMTSLGDSLEQFTLMPYVEYYRRTGPAAVADLIDGILTYALLGLLMFERRYRLRQPVNRWALVAFAIAATGFSLLLETVQLSLPSRSSGLTDVVNAMVGVWVGYRLWRLLSQYRQSGLVPISIEVSSRSGLRVRDH